jgi:hypothetical protein
MKRNLARAAWELDEWLQSTLGRPYNALLGVGLGLGTVHQIEDLPKDLHSSSGGVVTVLIVVMDLALLINQIGQLHQHRERRRAMPKRKPRAEKPPV